MNYERGGDDNNLFEEAESSSRPSSEYLNKKDDSVSEFNASTCSDDNFYDIFDNEEEIITGDSIVWVNTIKKIWEGRVIKIPFSDFPDHSKHLKLICINTKKEDRVLIRNCSKEYKHKIIPISNQIYKDGGVVEKYLLDITDSLRKLKQGM